MNQTEKEAQDIAEYIQIVFPLAQLPHLTHHLSSHAVGHKPYSMSCNLKIQNGQSYSGTISLELCIEFLQPVYTMRGTIEIHVKPASWLEDVLREILLRLSGNVEPNPYLHQWLTNNEALVKRANDLREQQRRDEAGQLALYVAMVLNMVYVWYIEDAAKFPGPSDTRDLYGYDYEWDLRWHLRKRMEVLREECDSIGADCKKWM